MNRQIITLCGSTKFKEQFLSTAMKLTLEGKVVLMPHIFSHADNLQLTVGQKVELDLLHKYKIEMSNGIYVIDVGGYIGFNTKREIKYASGIGKSIEYYSKGVVSG